MASNDVEAFRGALDQIHRATMHVISGIGRDLHGVKSPCDEQGLRVNIIPIGLWKISAKESLRVADVELTCQQVCKLLC